MALTLKDNERKSKNNLEFYNNGKKFKIIMT